MTRALLVTRYLCARCVSPHAQPHKRHPYQSPPDGWVVLPVDEYRALRERANPQPPQPAAASGRCHVDAHRLRPPHRERHRRRPRAAHHRRPARRLDARADSGRPDGARRATRRTAGAARRGAAAARLPLARRPRRAHARHRARRSPRLRARESIALPGVGVTDLARGAGAAAQSASICRVPAASSPSASRPPARAAGRIRRGRISR